MRARLGLRVFAVLAALNLLIFSGLGVFLADRLEVQRTTLVREFTEQIVATLEGTILSAGSLNVPRILQWPGWKNVSDAVLVDVNLEKFGDDAGHESSAWPRGVALHPVGQIGTYLDRPTLFGGLAEAIRERRRVELLGGLAVPLVVEGRTWGALWYVSRKDATQGDLYRLLWTGFALSTVLILVGTFAALRPLVLDPVQRLAGAAARIESGDLAARVEAGERRDEVSELLRTFNRMAARVQALSQDLEREVAEALASARRAERAALIQKRLAAMGELAAGIAHEINNPLGGLKNAVTSLRQGGLPEGREERYLELLTQGLERIERTVGQVLRMAPRETVAARIDLVEVVRDAASLVRHRAEREGHTLCGVENGRSFDPCEPPQRIAGRYEVLGARHELGQALLNLLVNALDAVEELGRPGRVEIALLEDGDRFAFRVADDGPGVEPDRLERVTDLFYSTKDPGRGTGLGLAIVHNVLDTHGGELVLSSAPGRGFEATCFLPKAPRT